MQLNVHLPFSYYMTEDLQNQAPLFQPENALVEAYRDALLREICSLGADLEDCTIDSVFFRGGYMSLLDPTSFAQVMAGIHRSFHLARDVQVSGVLFPGSLNMALASEYRNHHVRTLFFETPSLLARECEKLRLPNALQALDQTLYFMQNFQLPGFSLRLPIGIPGRDEGIWTHILGQIRHYQPESIAFFPLRAEIEEHPMFLATCQSLLKEGYVSPAPLLLTRSVEPKWVRYLAPDDEVLGVGLGAQTRAEGFKTRNTTDLQRYLKYSGDYRQLITSVEEIQPNAL